MTMELINANRFDQKARLIRSQVSIVLRKWGLLPRFKRWRLTQDADTGMIVLFGILNNQYIARQTSIPFNQYFNPHMLHDLANELQVQVVSCNSEGLRYAFILDRGRLGKLPTHIDFPFIDNGKLLVRVVYNDVSQSFPMPSAEVAVVDDHMLVRQGIGAFVNIFEELKSRENPADFFHAQDLPDIVMINRDEFNKRVAEHEINRRRSKHIKNLFNGIIEEKRQ